jgi:hypothetical protein
MDSMLNTIMALPYVLNDVYLALIVVYRTLGLGTSWNSRIFFYERLQRGPQGVES